MVFNFLVHNIFLTLNFLNSVYQKSQIFSIDKYCIIFSFIINPPSIITCLKLFKDIIKKKINLMMGKIQIYQKRIFQITVLSQTGFPENMYYLLHKEKRKNYNDFGPYFHLNLAFHYQKNVRKFSPLTAIKNVSHASTYRTSDGSR